MPNTFENHRVDNDDEIDLRELFFVLKARKKIIYSIVTIATITAIFLSFFVMKSVYSVKSMIEIGTIKSKNSNQADNYVLDMVEKISYEYRIGVKGIKRKLPYINQISLPEKSKNIILIEVYARNDTEGTKYLQVVSKKIISDSNKKTHAYMEDIRKQIKLFENDLLSSSENYKKIEKSIDAMNQNVASLSKLDPALAAIYAMQISQKDSVLNGIKNTIITIKKKIEDLRDSISTNNIDFTKIIDKIQVLENPIKPKKTLIVVVTFITSLIFSIFLVFFLNFIEGIKKEDA